MPEEPFGWDVGWRVCSAVNSVIEYECGISCHLRTLLTSLDAAAGHEAQAKCLGPT